jgi:arylsulfatase A-like enzyme
MQVSKRTIDFRRGVLLMKTIDRRDFMSGAALLGAALPFAKSAYGEQASVSQKPNIVFILADDLGYADLSCYGRPDIATPNIDCIAADGVRFLQGYANSSVCSATRTALITGRYQYHLPLGLEEPLGNKFTVGLPPAHPTLPSLLKQVGYRTALLGKWHLGSLPTYSPLKSGYDYFYGFRSGAVDYFTHKSPGAVADLWENDTAIRQEGYLTDLLGNRAVGLVGDFAKTNAPFLLSLHFNAPHWPWEGPTDQAEAARLDAPGLILDYDGGSQDTYRQMVERLDYQVGQVLQALDRNRLRNNTIVIFTSDNGGERFADTWPFTGKKLELLEGGLRIPNIIRWPDRIRAGRTHNQVNITMDWVPTLLAAAGASPDPAYPLEGMNLLPALTQDVAPVPRKLFWRYKGNAQRAYRDGDYKILKIRDQTFLFNVVEDPLERANLKNRQRPVYDRMVSEWDAWNATMLPESPDSATSSFTGANLADHYGAPAVVATDLDNSDVWPD